MKMILCLLFSLSSSSFQAQDHLLKIHNELTQIKLELIEDSLTDMALVNSIQTNIPLLKENNRMKESLENFISLYESGYRKDTLLSVINIFSDEFYRLYGENIYNQLLPRSETKFLMFTTTLSCECTIKMCRDYEKAVIPLLKKNNPASLIIIDSYSNDTLTEKYNISFVPVLIILSPDGEEVVRFSREETISEKLNQISSYKEKI